MLHFHYSEDDPEGLETLEAIKDADAFNAWMFSRVKPYLSSPVLEIGSGIGNLSRCCLEDDFQTTLSDIRPAYCRQLHAHFDGHPHLSAVWSFDLVDPNFDANMAICFGTFNSVFALNVVEHIEDDLQALKNMHKLLAKGGKVVILVPAGQWLYNKLDKNLQHYKRYSKRSLEGLLMDAGFEIETTSYFNALGIPAWMYGGLTSKLGVISHGQMSFYNKLVPLAKLFDAVLMKKSGLSVISVGVKK
jgi:SAM-dependent methyltransferase